MTRGKRAGNPTPTLVRAKPGSISHGTLKTNDLLQAFLGVLDHLDEDKTANVRDELKDALLEQALGENDMGEATAELLADTLEQLTEILQDHAPLGHRFGAHEGDGADFGFWPEADPEADGRPEPEDWDNHGQ